MIYIHTYIGYLVRVTLARNRTVVKLTPILSSKICTFPLTTLIMRKKNNVVITMTVNLRVFSRFDSIQASFYML